MKIEPFIRPGTKKTSCTFFCCTNALLYSNNLNKIRQKSEANIDRRNCWSKRIFKWKLCLYRYNYYVIIIPNILKQIIVIELLFALPLAATRIIPPHTHNHALLSSHRNSQKMCDKGRYSVDQFVLDRDSRKLNRTRSGGIKRNKFCLSSVTSRLG